MLIKKPSDIPYSEITPQSTYLNRRAFLADAALAGAAAGAALIAGRGLADLISPRSAFAGEKISGVSKSPLSINEPFTSYDDVTHYNNFYEFGTDKAEPAVKAKNFKTSPWSVSIEGEVAKPKKLDMDAIMKLAPLEERVYRHRCVEAWSIVVPWIGYSLSALLKTV